MSRILWFKMQQKIHFFMNSGIKFLVRGIKKLIRDSRITNPKFLLWNLWRDLTKSNIHICDSVVPMITVKPGWHCLLSFCIFFLNIAQVLYMKRWRSLAPSSLTLILHFTPLTSISKTKFFYVKTISGEGVGFQTYFVDLFIDFLKFSME